MQSAGLHVPILTRPISLAARLIDQLHAHSSNTVLVKLLINVLLMCK